MTCEWEKFTGVECEEQATKIVAFSDGYQRSLCTEHAVEYLDDLKKRQAK